MNVIKKWPLLDPTCLNDPGWIHYISIKKTVITRTILYIYDKNITEPIDYARLVSSGVSSIGTVVFLLYYTCVEFLYLFLDYKYSSNWKFSNLINIQRLKYRVFITFFISFFPVWRRNSIVKRLKWCEMKWKNFISNAAWHSPGILHLDIAFTYSLCMTIDTNLCLLIKANL